MLLTNLFSAHRSSSNHDRNGKNRRRRADRTSARRFCRAPRFESLEGRAMMAVLAVDINDPIADLPGDNLYAQIQEAINVAAPGDEILVSGGTYAPITVGTDNLTIQAVGSADVIIDAVGVPGSDAVTLNANGVTVRGLIAQNAVVDFSSPPFPGGIGFAVNGTDIKLSGNTARNNRDGFRVLGDSNTLVGNTASDNFAFGINVSADSNTVINNTSIGNGNGFFLSGAEHNTLRSNLAESSRNRGFFAVASSKNTFEGNIARANGLDGFFLLAGSSSNTLRGNRAEGNGLRENPAENFGFLLFDGSDNNILQGNTAVGNTGEGFAIGASNFNTFQGNIAKWNGESGFLVVDSDSNRFSANTALQNGENGFVLIGDSDANTFKNNSAVRNGEYGFFVDEALADENLFEHNHCLLNLLGGSNIDDIC